MKAMLSPVLMIVLAESTKGALWYFQQMDAAGMAVALEIVALQAEVADGVADQEILLELKDKKIQSLLENK